MSTVIAYSTPEFVLLGTDTYTRTDSGIERFDAEKLHRWPQGWCAGVGLGNVLDGLAEFLQRAPIQQPADVQDLLTVHWRMFAIANPTIADRIDATSGAVMHAGRIFVIGPRQGYPKGGVLSHGFKLAFAPEDTGASPAFEMAYDGFGKPTDELDAVRQAARFVAEVSRFSNDVSGTVDTAVNDRRFRGDCMEVADDPEALEVGP